MSAKTTYASNKVRNKLFGGTDFDPPDSWFIAFLDIDSNELSGNGYARVEVENNTTNFPDDTDNSEACQMAIETPEAVGGDWDEARFVALFDAASGGNLWFKKAIVPFTVLEGQVYNIPAGNLTILEQ